MLLALSPASLDTEFVDGRLTVGHPRLKPARGEVMAVGRVREMLRLKTNRAAFREGRPVRPTESTQPVACVELHPWLRRVDFQRPPARRAMALGGECQFACLCLVKHITVVIAAPYPELLVSVVNPFTHPVRLAEVHRCPLDLENLARRDGILVDRDKEVRIDYHFPHLVSECRCQRG